MPERERAGARFLEELRLPRSRPDLELLEQVGEACGRFPYENLTKLLKRAGTPDGADPRRLPDEVLTDHLTLGAGGTCFSLTALFQVALEELGFRVRPAMCEMRAGPERHCALVVELPDGPWLLDPAYLLHRPLPLRPEAVSERRTELGDVTLAGEPGGRSFSVSTLGTWRYRLSLEPVSPARFRRRWEESFGWGGMSDLHASRLLPTGYAYLHGRNLRLQEAGGKRNENLRGREVAAVAERFGLAPELVAQAYALVERQRAARASAP